MNNCIFLGVVKNSVFTEDDGIKKVVFDLFVTTTRKSRAGKVVKDKVTVTCEAWDSAADVIQNHCNERLILVRAAAKNIDGKTYFRVNEFVIPDRN